jgi:acyl carrier protein
MVQEFSIEIPDKEADAIHSGMLMQDTTSRDEANLDAVNQAVDYILAQPDGMHQLQRLAYLY